MTAKPKEEIAPARIPMVNNRCCEQRNSFKAIVHDFPRFVSDDFICCPTIYYSDLDNIQNGRLSGRQSNIQFLFISENNSILCKF